jgi:hypothetical protein
MRRRRVLWVGNARVECARQNLYRKRGATCNAPLPVSVYASFATRPRALRAHCVCTVSVNSLAGRAHVCDTVSVTLVQEPAGTLMARRNSASFRLSFVAVLFGLYALCMTGGTRASAAEQCAIARHADPVSFVTNPETAAQLRCVSHLRVVRAVPRASAPTSLFQAVSVITPGFVEATPTRENALALGGTRRTPGPSRAPPAA